MSIFNVNSELPLPSFEMRQLVGPTDPAAFENPSGKPVFDLSQTAYHSVLDFGCGCGRLARRMMLQKPQPRSYLGFDLHAGMIKWCQANLTPRAPNFRFVHHDVANLGFNPGAGKPETLPMPAESGSVTLLLSWSVFTHTLQHQTEHYIAECSRVLAKGGTILATFFVFDKSGFPMMQDFQNALYINSIDPTNAVILDRAWLLSTLHSHGLIVTRAEPPRIRGFQWLLHIRRTGDGLPIGEIPDDSAPVGRAPPPTMTRNPWEIA